MNVMCCVSVNFECDILIVIMHLCNTVVELITNNNVILMIECSEAMCEKCS
jgi:hypothetical protein